MHVNTPISVKPVNLPAKKMREADDDGDDDDDAFDAAAFSRA